MGTRSLKAVDSGSMIQLLVLLVASFTSTAVAAERALGAKLPIASSQKQAEQLLQETAEAQQASLSLKGIHDLRGLLEAASRNRVLHPVHLDGVAARVADRLAEKEGETALFPALQNLGRGIKSALPNLRHSIRHCIEDGRVLDRASDQLSKVRGQRRDNMQSLRQSMNEWARKLAAQNVSEEALVVIRRDRLCVPVKAGRQSQLPKGSVTLAVSASKSTVYMEPEPVVTLNNAEAMLRGQEQEEEQAILAGLSQMARPVKTSTLNLQRLLKAVTALDIATARARHAAWLQAVKPVFLSVDEAAQTGCIQAKAVYHPLLLEPSLPPLKEPPATEAVNYDASYTASPSGSAAADSMGRASWEPQQPPRQTYGRRGLPKGRAPCPVDLLVPAGVKVVAVTGPNTGHSLSGLHVGSGTDPAEGAALAGVLLDRLADTACLTYATTHHAQLKDRPASDRRFINASVEFDLATLKPTYRLLWGEGGLSNALAVAQGLGFDPKVVQRAREIALIRPGESPCADFTRGVFSLEGGSPTARAQQLQWSLQQELRDAKQQAAAAAATRREAEETLADLQAQAQEVAHQHEAFKNSDAQLQAALTAAQSDLDWVVSEIKAGKLSQQEAEECIQQVSDSVPSITAAAAAVQRAKARGQEDVWGWESARVKAGSEGWTPKVDEPVRLVKLGGKTGKVTAVASDGQLTVKMGALSMQVDAADAAPVSQSKASRAAAAAKALGAASKTYRDGSPASNASQSSQVVTFQTEANTVDVRGQNSDEALSQVEAGLSSVSASFSPVCSAWGGYRQVAH
ncbi:MAG: 2 family [Trebouxia sp. A1-2]|nr:MAG: 2 family [Trebouxia sp. A1-2]